MFQIKTENPNYLAKIVSLPEPRRHSNADKLLCVNIDANNVITSLSSKKGELFIYFPLECAINKDYLSWSNSYSDAELNKDKTKKGFFNAAGRVKAIKLRGERSEGYIIPVTDLTNWLESIDQEVDGKIPVGNEFSHFNDILICEKYVNRQAVLQAERAERKLKKKVKRESKLVDNQFRLHEDTEALKKNIWKINPDDLISIGYKMHGCVDKDTLIETKEHGQLRIQEIVEKRLKLHIKAYDTNLNKEVWAKVDDYYFLPNDGDWYEIELEDGSKVEITGNNPVWLPELECYRKVEDLKLNDILLKSN